MEVIQHLLPASLYNWKAPYTMVPEFIVVHNTYNDASARNEIKYMVKSKAEGGRQVSYHYAIDDKEIVQGVRETRNTWNAGDGRNGEGNRKGIAIEICYSKSGGERFIKAEQLAAKFIASRLKHYNWGIDKVKKHQDFNGKYCPHRTLDLGWDRFLKMIESELDMNTYTVKKGDALWKIAQQFNTTVDELVKLNNLKNPDKLEIGQVLIIKANEIDKLKIRVSELENKVEEYKDTIDTLRTERDALKDARASEIERLEAEIKELDDELNSFEKITFYKKG